VWRDEVASRQTGKLTGDLGAAAAVTRRLQFQAPGRIRGACRPMKIDALFPPPPPFNGQALPCSDLTPGRASALARLSLFAAEAERLVGTLPAPGADAPAPPFKATSRDFALYCYRESPYVAELQELLARSKLHIAADDHVDAPHVMLIDVRKYWGVLGPIRGDTILLADGQAAVVTKSLCGGCQHFEGVSLMPDGEPQILKRTHWTSTVKWIVRLIDESPLPVPVAEPAPAAPPAEAPPAEPAPSPADAPPAAEGSTRKGRKNASADA